MDGVLDQSDPRCAKGRGIRNVNVKTGVRQAGYALMLWRLLAIRTAMLRRRTRVMRMSMPDQAW